MKLSTTHSIIFLGLQIASTVQNMITLAQQHSSIQNILIDKCCQVGREKAIESSKFNCKLSARDALLNGGKITRNNLLTSAAESLLSSGSSDSSFADQCEMVLESCCLGHHRTRNCDSGKQFAKSSAACMDVELSKEATIATESFNDCCMACSLGILAARNPAQNESSSSSSLDGEDNNTSAASIANRCKLMSPLASSLSGQLYESTYNECCQENLPRVSGALLEPGSPIDCAGSNPCSQRCISYTESSNQHRRKHDRCDCFSGFKLGPDGVTCLDIDECKLNLHTCDREAEICDNTKGSFRCLARRTSNSNDHIALESPELSQAGHFMSMRLCPFGSRWNSNENQCEPNIGGETPPVTERRGNSQQQQHFSSHSSSSSSFRRIRSSSSRTVKKTPTL